MSTEAAIQRAILNRIGSMSDCRLFRNTVGVGFVGRPPRRISFGLAPGSADLIGITRYQICPSDIGTIVGLFTSIEVKRDASANVKLSQERWRQMVANMGGIAAITHNPDEIVEYITNWTP